MKAHTNDFKNQIKTLGRQVKAVITYGNTTLEEELFSVTPHYKSDILKSVMKELDIESSVDIPLETVINCKIGLLINNSYEMLDYGNYVVFKSEKQEDTNTYKITCYDKMIYSMKQNENLNVQYPISIKNYLIALATKIGLSVASSNFYNESLEIPRELYLGLEYTYRDILDEIAQATGSIICINNNDEIEVRYPNITNDTIDEEYLKDVNVKFGEIYGPINTVILSRSAGADKISLSYPENLPDEQKIAIEISENQIMNDNNRSDYLEGILYAVNGLTYSINDFTSTGILYYDIYDKYNVQIGENTYPCIMLNDEIEITTGIKELIYTDMPKESDTDYSKTDKTDKRINQTYLIVDKQNQQINAVITQTTDMSNPNSIAYKQSVLTQRVDSLDSKIQEVADITTSAENYQASVFLENINQSEPIEIRIRPTGTNISYLYPHEGLYPDDILYPTNRMLLFTRIYEEGIETKVEYIYYELPDDLLYYDSENYDEFYLNYDSQTCQVVKKCKYNADGTVSLLTNTETNDYPYPEILLGDGDYRVNILGYDTGYIFVRLMASNIYTSQFATRSEVSSEISQTATEIDLSVNQKLTNYSTTTEMNSAINVKANEINSVVSTKVGENEVISKINQSSEAVTILANKLGLTANDIINLIAGNTINLTSKNIVISSNNFNVDTTGNMTCRNANVIGGEIKLGGDNQTANFVCQQGNNKNSISPYWIEILNDNGLALVSGDSLQIGDDISSNGGFFYSRNGDQLNVYSSTGTRMLFLSNNSCVLRNGNNDTTLQVYNDGKAYINGYRIQTTSSDENLKNNIKDTNVNAINLIKSIKHKQFDWKNNNSHQSIGYIAQELEKINKDFIIKDNIKDDYGKNMEGKYTYQINILSVLATTTKAIQEQQQMIEQLQKEIKELKGEK